jgi:hypothetical protein
MGAHYLAEALKVNTVRYTADIFHKYDEYCCAQTLSTLDLALNDLGSTGAQYLADALKVNQVSYSLAFSVRRP